MASMKHLYAMAALISTLSILSTIPSIKGIGVNYGRMANNLPPPHQVAQFLAKNTFINHIKLYDSDATVMKAFARTGISVDITIPNNLIPYLTDLPFAHHWVKSTILPYPNTKITRVIVGNEVLYTGNKTMITSLVPAMQNIHTALAPTLLLNHIKVSTTHSLAVLSISSPPSVGRFRDSGAMKPLLSLLRATDSPFMVNAYPFFGFTPETLDYSLFKPNSGVFDPNTGLTYHNMLDAQLDAVFSAMKAMGFSDVGIVVAETGWPSVGGEAGVDVENAKEYNKNLVRHVSSGVGTPMQPNRMFETYIFALFNENLKPGPESERNFGLFRPDLTPVYDIGILRAGVPTAGVASAPPVEEKRRWCVGRSSSKAEWLQQNIDYACGQDFVDCGPILPSGVCFFPDTVQAHAAYAMNEYYQVTGRNPFDCDFGETGMVTTVDPSYGNCKYKS